MKQKITIETDELGKLHTLDLLENKFLTFLKFNQCIKTKSGFSLYFDRLNFNNQSMCELKKLKAQLKLLQSNSEIIFYNY